MRRTSAATTPPSDSFTTSPGASSAAGTVFHAPSRRTDALSASRDFSAVSVAWARLSWNSPRAALNTRRQAMIAASTYLPSTSSSRIAASSIQGTGAQNFSSAMRNGCTLVSGIALGPNFSSRRRASSLARPFGDSSFAGAADFSGKAFAEGGGAVVTMMHPALGKSLLARQQWASLWKAERRRPICPRSESCPRRPPGRGMSFHTRSWRFPSLLRWRSAACRPLPPFWSRPRSDHAWPRRCSPAP